MRIRFSERVPQRVRRGSQRLPRLPRFLNLVKLPALRRQGDLLFDGRGKAAELEVRERLIAARRLRAGRG